jgi:hypothetical protein
MAITIISYSRVAKASSASLPAAAARRRSNFAFIFVILSEAKNLGLI